MDIVAYTGIACPHLLCIFAPEMNNIIVIDRLYFSCVFFNKLGLLVFFPFRLSRTNDCISVYSITLSDLNVI